MHVTLTGASGFLGTALREALSAAGHRVHVAGRTRPASRSSEAFSPWEAQTAPFPQTALTGADAVIHLAGEPVAQRWTNEAKRKILDSRVAGTNALVRAMADANQRPATLISASAIGYYGDRGDERLTESSAAGTGFLAEVCQAWEAAARPAEALGVRVVRLRLGVVLGRGGGALQKMLLPFRLGLGGRIGQGQQWMSWIHVADVVGIILHALSNQALTGAVNATAPKPSRNSEFTYELGAALHRPTLFTVPKLALRVAYGEMSEMLTGGQYVEPAAALQSGYVFRYPELASALKDVV